MPDMEKVKTGIFEILQRDTRKVLNHYLKGISIMNELFVVLAILFLVFVLYYIISQWRDIVCYFNGHDIYWYPFVSLNNNMRTGKCKCCGKIFHKEWGE